MGRARDSVAARDGGDQAGADVVLCCAGADTGNAGWPHRLAHGPSHTPFRGERSSA